MRGRSTVSCGESVAWREDRGEALGRRFPDDTHARYNALLRRLVSYERELERRRYAASPSPDRATGSRAGPLARRGGLD